MRQVAVWFYRERMMVPDLQENEFVELFNHQDILLAHTPGLQERSVI